MTHRAVVVQQCAALLFSFDLPKHARQSRTGRRHLARSPRTVRAQRAHSRWRADGASRESTRERLCVSPAPLNQSYQSRQHSGASGQRKPRRRWTGYPARQSQTNDEITASEMRPLTEYAPRTAPRPRESTAPASEPPPGAKAKRQIRGEEEKEGRLRSKTTCAGSDSRRSRPLPSSRTSARDGRLQ